MIFLRFALTAAGSLLTLTCALPIPNGLSAYIQARGAVGRERSSQSSRANYNDIVKRNAKTYEMYTGNGQSSWPAQSSWLDFDTLFDQNTPIMKASCTQWNVPNNSDQEINDLRTAIQKVSADTGVDDRFILAVTLQESEGCVRVPTTNYGVRNPGLMQDHDGKATCNEGGNVQTPCPAATIEQMIRDGVAGTPQGPGLQQLIAQAPGSGVAKFYGAARLYNSGSIAPSGDLGQGVATHCYCSDIANRLTGWATAPRECTLDVPQPSAPATTAPAVTPPTYSQPEPAPTTSSPSPPATDVQPPPAPTATESQPLPAPSATSSKPFSAPPATNSQPVPNQPAPTKASASNRAPGVTDDCAQFYTVQAGDYCNAVAAKFGVTFDDLRRLNTELDSGCSNLWLGYAYCVKGL